MKASPQSELSRRYLYRFFWSSVKISYGGHCCSFAPEVIAGDHRICNGRIKLRRTVLQPTHMMFALVKKRVPSFMNTLTLPMSWWDSATCSTSFLWMQRILCVQSHNIRMFNFHCCQIKSSLLFIFSNTSLRKVHAATCNTFFMLLEPILNRFTNSGWQVSFLSALHGHYCKPEFALQVVGNKDQQST